MVENVINLGLVANETDWHLNEIHPIRGTFISVLKIFLSVVLSSRPQLGRLLLVLTERPRRGKKPEKWEFGPDRHYPQIRLNAKAHLSKHDPAHRIAPLWYCRWCQKWWQVFCPVASSWLYVILQSIYILNWDFHCRLLSKDQTVLFAMTEPKVNKGNTRSDQIKLDPIARDEQWALCKHLANNCSIAWISSHVLQESEPLLSSPGHRSAQSVVLTRRNQSSQSAVLLSLDVIESAVETALEAGCPSCRAWPSSHIEVQCNATQRPSPVALGYLVSLFGQERLAAQDARKGIIRPSAMPIQCDLLSASNMIHRFNINLFLSYRLVSVATAAAAAQVQQAWRPTRQTNKFDGHQMD